MSLIEAIFLGIFQGIAEFLPISSSGHLLILKNILGLEEVPALFDVILHLATFLSIIVVFWKKILGIFVAFFRWLFKKSNQNDKENLAEKENLAMVLPIIIATVCTAVIGLIIQKLDIVDPKFASAMLLLTAFILISTSFVKDTGKTFLELGKKGGIIRSIIVGIAQGIGVLPGISRSGITISASLASGIKRENAGEYSFILALPAILGAFILEIGDISKLDSTVSVTAILVSALCSFLVGVLSLRLLMPIIKKGKLAWFAIYLIPAGILGLFFL